MMDQTSNGWNCVGSGEIEYGLVHAELVWKILTANIIMIEYIF